MSRMRTLLPALLVALALALGAAWFLSTHERKQETEKLPPRGEATYNPLYALKLALRAQGQVVVSRQRLDVAEMALRPGDTVVLLGDPRTVTPAQWDDLFAFVDAGGHLVLRLPGWQQGVNPAGALAEWLPIEPLLMPGRCLSLRIPGQPDHVEFCRAPRFRLADDARPLAAWRNDKGLHAYARFAQGRGTVDLAGSLEMLDNRSLRDVPHQMFARQLLAPGWGQGRFHLVYAADMPPLWRWLLDHAWRALLPLALALLGWLWMRSQRFGPLLPGPAPARRSLLEHLQASGEHLLRYGRLSTLHRAMRDAVLDRLRRRDPLAAALEGDARAALVAQRSGLGVREVRAALDTRPPRDPREFRERIARLIDLRTRL